MVSNEGWRRRPNMQIMGVLKEDGRRQNADQKEHFHQKSRRKADPQPHAAHLRPSAHATDTNALFRQRPRTQIKEESGLVCSSVFPTPGGQLFSGDRGEVFPAGRQLGESPAVLDSTAHTGGGGAEGVGRGMHTEAAAPGSSHPAGAWSTHPCRAWSQPWKKPSPPPSRPWRC